jgi:hypothetical protein
MDPAGGSACPDLTEAAKMPQRAPVDTTKPIEAASPSHEVEEAPVKGSAAPVAEVAVPQVRAIAPEASSPAPSVDRASSEQSSAVVEPAPDGTRVAPSQNESVSAPPVAAEEIPLEISALRLCRRVEGFGRVRPFATKTCKPGQTVIIYCEMTGLRYEPHGDGFRSRLEAELEILPPQGSGPAWRQVLGVADDTCHRPRQDYFVSYRFSLPEHIPPGIYQLRLQERDTLNGQSASRNIELRVAP